MLRLRLVFVQLNGCRLFVTLLKFVEGVLLSYVNLDIQYQYSGTKYESRCDVLLIIQRNSIDKFLKTAKDDRK